MKNMAVSIPYIKEEIVIVDVDIDNDLSNDCDSPAENNENYVVADIYLNKTPLEEPRFRKIAPKTKEVLESSWYKRLTEESKSKGKRRKKRKPPPPDREPFVITYRCIVCSIVFTDFKEYQAHVNEHSPSDLPCFTCDECPRRFSTELELQQHIKKNHDFWLKPSMLPDNTPVIVSIPDVSYVKTEVDDYGCDDSYITLEEAKEIQIKMEEEEFQDSPPPSEPTNSLLREQLMKDSEKERTGPRFTIVKSSRCKKKKGERVKTETDGFVITYKCIVCEAVFTDFSEFQEHLNGHSDKAGFACEICLERFLCKPDLQEHLRLFHNI